jgi:hypothetical protein
MKHWIKALLLTLTLGLGGVGLVGCDQGRFEEAGEDIDDALD